MLRGRDIHPVSPRETVSVFCRSPVRVQKRDVRNETCMVFISLMEPYTPNTPGTAVWWGSVSDYEKGSFAVQGVTGVWGILGSNESSIKDFLR